MSLGLENLLIPRQSGRTSRMLYTAFRKALANPERKVFVVTYNHSMKSDIERMLKDYYPPNNLRIITLTQFSRLYGEESNFSVGHNLFFDNVIYDMQVLAGA